VRIPAAFLAALLLPSLLARPAPAGPAEPLAVLSDVEGKWSKLETFAARNPAVFLDARGRLQLRPGARFVFCGDAVDQGPSGMRVVDALVDLKRREPDRVTLIAGNRDINKIRLPRELSAAAMAQPPAPYLEWLAGQGADARDDRSWRLRWILAKTMGAPNAFAHRRAELAAAAGAAGSAVSDDRVVESFLAELAPGGRMRELLRHSQLAYRSPGRTAVFVHGGLTAENFGRVPGSAAGYEELDSWLSALNAWFRAEVARWERGAPAPGQSYAGQALVEYQQPLPGTRANPESVVYARYSDETGNPRLPAEELSRRLSDAGIRWVISGHTPQGDAPTVLDAGPLKYVVVDNTEAAHGSQVILDESRGLLSVDSLATLEGEAEPRKVAYALGADAEGPLGRRIPGTPWLVKGILRDPAGWWAYLTTRVLPQAFRVEQRAAGPQELLRVELAR
jgi:hypothetical protein